MSAPAEHTTPPLHWQNVSQLNVLCVVSSDRFARHDALQAEICDQVRTLATRDAPMPVRIAAFGDPLVIERGTATLLVHLNIQENGLAALSIRSYRPAGVDTDTLFGAPPRALQLEGPSPAPAALAEAIAAMLAETLPWVKGR